MSIAKNTAYITTAFVLQKILAFFYVALIARNTGPELIGKYFFALSFTTVFSIFMDMGLTPVLIREVAKYNKKAKKYFNNIVTLKLFFSVTTLIGIFITINLMGYDSFTKNLVYMASIVMLLDSLTLTFYGLLRSHQVLKVEAIGIILYQVITVMLGGAIVLLADPQTAIPLLIAVLCISSFLNAIYSFVLAKKVSGVKFVFSINKKFAKYAIIIASPFFLAGIFNRIYTHIDMILLSKLAGDAYVGWYGVANKFVFAMQFIPSAFVASIYPAMSNYFEHSRGKLIKTFERSITYLMIISVPICFGAISLSREIITTLYGPEFTNSILPLNLLSVSLIFVFLYFPVGSLLNASNRQKRNTMNMGIAMLINVILNLVLIPKYNLAGAATASIISQGLMLFLGMYYVNQIIKYNKKLLFIKFIKNIISAMLMFVFVLFLKEYINWILIIPMAGLFYGAVLFLIGGYSKEDIYQILSSAGIKKYG